MWSKTLFPDNNNLICKKLYNNLNITAFIGLNGSGKTTILSLIAAIFRYIERGQEKIPTDFELYYNINNSNVILRRDQGLMYIKVDNNADKILLKTERKNGKLYYNKDEIPTIFKERTVFVDDVIQYLPSNVLVSGFDKEYELEYHSRLIAKRIVKVNTNMYYDTAYGLDISLGMFRFFDCYFSSVSLRKTFHKMDLSFSDEVYVRYSPPVCYYEEKNSHLYNYDLFLDKYYIKPESLTYFNELLEIREKYSMELSQISIDDFMNGSFFDIFRLTYSDDGFNLIFSFSNTILKHKFAREIINLLISHKYLYFNNFLISRIQKYNIKNMSTGEKLLMGRIFFFLSHIENESILILEEPELHLNYFWNKHYISILQDLMNNYKSHVLISSHDYGLISSLFSEQILLLDSNGVRSPTFKTFLADENIILSKLVKQSLTENSFEEKVISALDSDNIDMIKEYFSVMGESYLKIVLFKKLVELGEISVES